MPALAELPTPDELMAAPEWGSLEPSQRSDAVDAWALETRNAHPWTPDEARVIDSAVDDFHAKAAPTKLEKVGKFTMDTVISGTTSLAALPFAPLKLGLQTGKGGAIAAGDALGLIDDRDVSSALAAKAPDALKLGQGYERTLEGGKTLAREYNPLSENDEAWQSSLDALKKDVLDRKLPEDPDQLYSALKKRGMEIAQATAKLHGENAAEYLPMEWQDIDEEGMKSVFREAMAGKRVEGFRDQPSDVHRDGANVMFKNQSRSLVASPENLGLLMQFSATRNPKYFDALVQRLGRSRTRQEQDVDTAGLDAARKEDAMDVAVRNIFSLGGTFPEAGEHMVQEVQGLTSSPIDMASTAFSFGLGRAAVNAAKTSLLKAGGKVALGGGVEFLQGATSALGDQSVPTMGNVVEQGLMEAAAGGVVQGAGAVTQAVINKATTPEAAPPPLPPLPPGHEGATDADFEQAESAIAPPAAPASVVPTEPAATSPPPVPPAATQAPAASPVVSGTAPASATPTANVVPTQTATAPIDPNWTPPGFTNTAIPSRTEAGFVQLPEQFKGAWDHGVGLIKQGVSDFAQWSVEMVKKFGEAIREHLQKVWEAARNVILPPEVMEAVNNPNARGAGFTPDFMKQPAEPDMDAARAAATMPNAPDSESQARPLQDQFGSTPADYTAFTNEDMKARASAVVDAVGSVEQMGRLLSSEDGVRSLGLHPALQEYVQAETLKRASAAVDTAPNDVDRIRATQTLRKVRAAWDATGTQAGQHLVSRKLAGADLFDAMAVDEAIEKQQKATIDRAVPVEPVTQTVEKAAADASTQATETLAAALEDTVEEVDTPPTAAENARVKELEERVRKLTEQSAKERMAFASTTTTWKSITNMLAGAGTKKATILTNASSALKAQREAAQARIEARRKEGRVNALPVLEFADSAIIGASYLAEGLVDFTNWSQAMVREVGSHIAPALSDLYDHSSKLLLAEMELAKAKADLRSAKKDAGKKLRNSPSEAADVADKILDQIAETHSDPSSWPNKSKPHPVSVLYRRHLESPMGTPEFAAELKKLGVPGQLAETLARAAEIEIAALKSVARAKAQMADAKRGEMADEQAGKLIYAVSQQHRQAGTPLVNGPNKATIRSVFRTLVNKGMTFDQFASKLRALRVSDVVIDRLYRVGQRERAALDEAAVQGVRRKLLAEDSNALSKLLNTLRAKIAPGMKWRDIFTSQKTDQRSWELEVYGRIRQHEALQKLSPAEAKELAREMSKAWQRERRKVFNRELEKQLVKVAGIKPAAAAKVKAASPRLLQLINLGAFDSEAFRDAVAQEWGIKNLNSPEAKRLKDIATRIQQTPEGVPQRKLAQQFIEGLQDLTKLGKLELLESWWTASVLSGWRTFMDIGLGVANGIEDVGLGAMVTATRSGNADVAWRGIGRVIANLPKALSEALHHLLTGDKSLMRNFDAEWQEAMKDGNKMMNNAARQMRRSPVTWAPGVFMEFVARMLTALDHINSSSTFEGTKLMAMARHPELYKAALSIGSRERANARDQARRELTGGAPPSNRTERLQEDARVKEILDASVPTEIMAQATEMSRDAALQGDPTGLGYAVWWSAQQIGRLPGMVADSMERRGVNKGDIVLAALRRASTIVKVATGTKFVRTVAHAMNRNMSYVPGLGLLRLKEGSMTGAKADVLLAKQLLGTAVGLAIYSAFKGDDDKDEQGLEGSWKGLTPQRRSQLYAQGKQPNTVWYRDAKGRVRSYNYQQWGLASILGTVGAMNDQRKYHANKDELSVLINGIASGGMAWSDKAQLQGLQTLFGDSPYSSGSVADSLAQKLNRYAATNVGGMIPRIVKDIDALASPELRSSTEWWAKWAAQVPMLRETATGKRMDIFGADIKLDRGPLSRVTLAGTADPAYRILGQMNARGLWLSDPTTGVRKVKLGGNTSRDMTSEEKDRYQRAAGQGYKQFVSEHGEDILAMEHEAAKKYIQRHTKFIRDRAALQAVQ